MNRIGGCPTGQAVITQAYRLPAKRIVHTVGPVWRGGDQGEPALLAACYRNSLALAARHGLKTVAFPAISTGIYGYPLREAAAVATAAAVAFLREDDTIDLVWFCCFGHEALAAFQAECAKLGDS